MIAAVSPDPAWIRLTPGPKKSKTAGAARVGHSHWTRPLRARENSGMRHLRGGEAVRDDSTVTSCVRTRRVFAGFLFCAVLALTALGWPQNSNANSQNQNQSWTSTSENRDSNVGSST